MSGPAIRPHAEHEPDHIDAVILLQGLDHRADVSVLAQARQPDGIDWIAEGALDAKDRLQAAVRGRGERRKAQARRVSDVSDQRCRAARHCHHDHAVAVRQRREVEERSRLDECVDAVDQSDAVLAKQRGERLVPAGQRSGMRQRRALAQLTASELEDDKRLAPRGVLYGGAETPTVLGPLHEATDHRGRRVVGQKRNVIGHVHDGFVAARHEIIEADAAVARQFGDGIEKAAALRDDRDASAHGRRGNVRHGGGEAVVQARDAHAVRARDRHVGAARKRLELSLSVPPLVGCGVGKAFGDDEGGGDADVAGLGKNAEHGIGRHRYDHAIGNVRQILQRPVALSAADRGTVGIDRPDRVIEVLRLTGCKDLGAHPTFGDSDQRYRSRGASCRA